MHNLTVPSLDMAILYGGVDGQKFKVARPTLKARRSKTYFKKGKGVVAYTLLVNHIPLQTELIGAYEHESYFAFDIWYNNTSSIIPEAISGDMHIIRGVTSIGVWLPKQRRIFSKDGLLNTLISKILQACLDADLTEHLGYEKHEPSRVSNSRNGYSKKKIQSSSGDFDPRPGVD